VYGRALAQLAGTAVLRLANAEVVPFHFPGLTETVARYRDEVKSLLNQRRDAALEQNRQLDEGVFTALSDPREPTRPPARADVAPALNFAPLDNALTEWRRSAERYESAFARRDRTSAAAELNRVLRRVERALGDSAGLPRRPWYQHLLYAPGFYTGYGVKTLPGIREAIEQGYWAEAEREAARVATSLGNAARLVDSAAALLEGAPRQQ
jgi:N-acetylated-alpha-linked acidic dipeptidase